jgi:hypothetical protein
MLYTLITKSKYVSHWIAGSEFLGPWTEKIYTKGILSTELDYSLNLAYDQSEDFSGDQMKKNEVSGACSRYRGRKMYIQDFVGETWGKETTWKTQA